MTGFKSGIASSNEKNSFSAGQSLTKQALAESGVTAPSICLAFCSGNHDHHQFFQGIQSVLPKTVPILGGSGVGVITNHHLSYVSDYDENLHTAALAVLETPKSIAFRWSSVGDINNNEEQVGQALAKKLATTPDDKLMLLFFDSVNRPPDETHPPLMNSASYLLAGLTGNTFQYGIPIIGGGVLGDHSFGETTQFCGTSVGKQHVVAGIFSGDLEAHFCVTHGCSLLDGVPYTVTKAEGPILYELNSRPVVEILDELYGSDEWQEQIPLQSLSIGANQADKFTELSEENCNIRLIMGPTPDNRGILLFEADIKEGDEIQFVLRNSIEMIESARTNSRALVDKIHAQSKTPVFALYIDCAGRSGFFSGVDEEEATEIQQVLKENNIPLIGFYSGVEIAPIANKVKSLDWTGVLLILTM